jgi:hypothetical protein
MQQPNCPTNLEPFMGWCYKPCGNNKTRHPLTRKCRKTPRSRAIGPIDAPPFGGPCQQGYVHFGPANNCYKKCRTSQTRDLDTRRCRKTQVIPPQKLIPQVVNEARVPDEEEEDDDFYGDDDEDEDDDEGPPPPNNELYQLGRYIRQQQGRQQRQQQLQARTQQRQARQQTRHQAQRQRQRARIQGLPLAAQIPNPNPNPNNAADQVMNEEAVPSPNISPQNNPQNGSPNSFGSFGSLGANGSLDDLWRRIQNSPAASSHASDEFESVFSFSPQSEGAVSPSQQNQEPINPVPAPNVTRQSQLSATSSRPSPPRYWLRSRPTSRSTFRSFEPSDMPKRTRSLRQSPPRSTHSMVTRSLAQKSKSEKRGGRHYRRHNRETKKRT